MPRAWKPGDALPQWRARNQRDKEAMRDWMFYQLENFYRASAEKWLKEPIDAEAGDATILELLDSSDRSERALGLAQLRRLNVRLLGPDADRIQWKRKRGRPKAEPHYKSSESPKGLIRFPVEGVYDYRSRVHMAKLAVPIIRNFWRERYDGKWHRSTGDIDAYEIAAVYFVVDEESVRRKPSGRHKPRAKNRQP
jgi:hypothetical protein